MKQHTHPSGLITKEKCLHPPQLLDRTYDFLQPNRAFASLLSPPNLTENHLHTQRHPIVIHFVLLYMQQKTMTSHSWMRLWFWSEQWGQGRERHLTLYYHTISIIEIIPHPPPKKNLLDLQEKRHDRFLSFSPSTAKSSFGRKRTDSWENYVEVEDLHAWIHA